MDDAAHVHPQVWRWIKADGADLVSGLGTSMKGEWSGDQDLADGSLQKEYEHHQQWLKLICSFGEVKSISSFEIVEKLRLAKQHIMDDIDFICSNSYNNCTIIILLIPTSMINRFENSCKEVQ